MSVFGMNKKSHEETHQELRRRILSLPDVTEKQNAGSTRTRFTSRGKCSCTFMAAVIATFAYRDTIRREF
jgi:hypothetical protein